MGKTVVITGASAGIGLACARLFLQNGWTVYCLSRTFSQPDPVRHIPTDVSDEDSVNQAFAQIKDECGQIDLLINNAGFGISGATEFTTLTDAKRLFDVNFFGGFCCAKAAIPLMRERGGRILNVSSAAAIFSVPFQSFYSASKSAVNALTLAFRNELAMFGISVCAVMPGDIKTHFTASREKSFAGEDIYQGRIGPSVAVMEKDEQNGMSVVFISRFIYRVACKKHVSTIYTAGVKYKLFALLSKCLPSRLVNFIVGKLYVKTK